MSGRDANNRPPPTILAGRGRGPRRTSATISADGAPHAAAHAAVASALGTKVVHLGCPRPVTPVGLPNLSDFRRDLAVLVAGLAAELLALGQPSASGVSDLVAAIELTFTMFMAGTHWPEPPWVLEAEPALLAGPAAEIIVIRTVAETERAVATAIRILLASRVTRIESTLRG
jgi:hypothetical protein